MTLSHPPNTITVLGTLPPLRGLSSYCREFALAMAPVYMTVCLCFKLRKKPVVLTVHNVMPHEGSRLYKAVSAMLFRLGDHFIVHTEPNRRQLMTRYGIAPGRISVIAHGPLQFGMDTSP